MSDSAVLLSQEELEKTGREWQDLLELSNWLIQYRLLPVREMPDESLGHCDRVYNERRAVIKVMDPATAPGTNIHPEVEQDWEETLVHELLHIPIGDIHRQWEDKAEEYLPPVLWKAIDGNIGDAVEQTINNLARTLVKLKRMAQTQQEAPTS
jgi:hypothetical protein